MAYKNFTINQIRKQFAIEVVKEASLFSQITPVEPGEMTRYFLNRHIPLAEAIGI